MPLFTDLMKSIPKSDYLKRIMHYCAISERCTKDVVQKLTAWNVPEEEIDAILQRLVQDHFLDDARYARSYVADKWKLDQWGRGKISNGLFQKGISEVLIQKSMETIDQDQYIAGLHGLLSKKRDTLGNDAPVQQMKKIISFGSSRGFEEELIWQWLEKEGLSFDRT